jgi:hypothetical protein
MYSVKDPLIFSNRAASDPFTNTYERYSLRKDLRFGSTGSCHSYIKTTKPNLLHSERECAIGTFNTTPTKKKLCLANKDIEEEEGP